MAPDAGGTMRKIPENARTEPGWALARFGDGGWWPAIERGFRAGRIDDEVVVALADIVRGAGRRSPGSRPFRRRAWATLYPVGRAPRRGARRRAARARRAHGTSSAPARDGQRRPAGRQRPRRFRDHRDSPARNRRPPRRPAPLGLDTRDGRRPTAESWSAGRTTGGTRNVVLGKGSNPAPACQWPEPARAAAGAEVLLLGDQLGRRRVEGAGPASGRTGSRCRRCPTRPRPNSM